MQIIWSKTAEKNYLSVLNYLLENWSKKEIIKLDNKVNQLLKKITTYKTICPPSKKINTHKCVVDENNSLAYQLKSKKLYIVDFISHKKASRY